MGWNKQLELAYRFRDWDEVTRLEAEELETVELSGGQTLKAHKASKCQGECCCIHNPSDHYLSNAPLYWREDRGIMERICHHGVGHPDPDGLVHSRDSGIHGCDGCCSGWRFV